MMEKVRWRRCGDYGREMKMEKWRQRWSRRWRTNCIRCSKFAGGLLTVLGVDHGAECAGILLAEEGALSAQKHVAHHQRPLKAHPLPRPKPLKRRHCTSQDFSADASLMEALESPNYSR